jgi:hypothetical protein
MRLSAIGMSRMYNFSHPFARSGIVFSNKNEQWDGPGMTGAERSGGRSAVPAKKRSRGLTTLSRIVRRNLQTTTSAPPGLE